MFVPHAMVFRAYAPDSALSIILDWMRKTYMVPSIGTRSPTYIADALPTVLFLQPM